MTDTKEPEIEVLPAARRAASRRVFSVEEKRSMVEEAQRPGSSISLVSRKYKIASSLPFRWRRLMDEGSRSGLGAGEAVAESELKEAKARIRELERLLGKKTLEVEILKDAVELVRSKKLISRSLLPSKSRGDR